MSQPAAPVRRPRPAAHQLPAQRARAGARPAELFQLLTMQRQTALRVMGQEIPQQLDYEILSQLDLQPPDEDGSFRVTQRVLTTRLLSAASLSQGQYEKSLNDLVGKSFTFRLNHQCEVISMEGYEPERTAAPVEALGGTGFQLTSIMDRDGWKEMIQLSFLEPARHIAPGQPWTRQMGHDYSPLGTLSGTTTFRQDADRGPPLLYFTYTHDMKFTPAATASSALPLPVSDVTCTPLEARGRFVYDPAKRHVTEVDEQFHVQTSLSAELMGRSAKLELDERQQLTIRLSTQNPRS